MQINKLLPYMFLLAVVVHAGQINLKTGWNLIGINSTEQVNNLTNNQHIIRAAGGGVGGGSDFNYNRDYAQYATGTMKQGQGYWVKVDADSSLTYTKAASLPSSINLKTGWNLINTCVEIDAKNVINDYPNVIRAAGGGVGGGSDFNYNRDYAQYATGITKVGQGYWFKVDQDMSITCASPYLYRAWGIGGDVTNSLLTVMVNGVNYTLVPFSKLNIASSNASTAGSVTTFVGTLNAKDTKTIFTISSDYDANQVVIKVFKDSTLFTAANLVATSDPLIASNGAFIHYSINIQNPDDFRPIAPTDTNIAMPPVAPTF